MTAKRSAPGQGVETDAESEAEAEARDRRVLLHMPVDVRSLSLAVVAVLASIFFLQWAREVIIPLLLGVMFSYALKPAVDRLQRWRVPPALGAAVVLLVIVGAIGTAMIALSDDATALVESLPEVAQKLRQTIQKPDHAKSDTSVSTIARVQQAASEIEKAAEDRQELSGANSRNVTRVVVEKSKLDIKDYLWTGTLGLASFLGQALIVLFLTFFLLASGNTFRRKMVKLAGPQLGSKKITVQALDEISSQIQLYLLVQVATSAAVGVLTGLIFWALRLDHAAVWGVFAGITNLIPYVGSVLVGTSSALVAFMQFGSINMGLLVGGSSFAIHTIVGNLVTPWLTGRAGRMSPLAVFVGLLVFGWLWGVWGLLLGVPILMVVKSICDRVDELKPVGELLGS